MIDLEVSDLGPADRKALFTGVPNLWGAQGLKQKLAVVTPDRRFVRYADLPSRPPVCHVGLTTTTGTVNDEVWTIAGLGGIVTVPSYQGQHHASSLIRVVLDRLKRQKFHDVAMVFCLAHRKSFYEKYDWISVPGAVWVDQPDGRVEVVPPYYVLWKFLRRVLPLTLKGPIRIEGRPW